MIASSLERLTGGPWGTLDQAEACLAPITTVRMLASREAADRLATLRVESMVIDRGDGEKSTLNQDLQELEWKGKENDRNRNNKGSETQSRCFCPDSCDSGIGYLPFGMPLHLGRGTRYYKHNQPR